MILEAVPVPRTTNDGSTPAQEDNQPTGQGQNGAVLVKLYGPDRRVDWWRWIHGGA